MARPKVIAPARRYHISGQSVCTIDGKDYYLGKHDSAEAIARYAVLIAEYQRNGLKLPEGFQLPEINPIVLQTHQDDSPILVRHITAAYQEFAKTYYANDPQMQGKIRRIAATIDTDHGDVDAEKFGPVRLEQLRNKWVAEGVSRPYANSLVNVVFRMFKWAVSKELTSVCTYDGLKTLAPLRRGKTEAREPKAVEAVPIEHVRKTASKLSPVLKAMVTIHIGTGLRPSELCRMKLADIDRTGPEWIFRPSRHKNMHKGKTRAVPLLGEVREAITNYINRPSDAYLFSPMESVAWHNARKRSQRRSKVQPSQIDRSKDNPKVKPGECYTKDSYRRALQRAAKEAGVPAWKPYQLRHLNLEQIADALSLEHAMAIGGHSDVTTTRIYAKIAEKKAIEAARHAPTLGGDV